MESIRIRAKKFLKKNYEGWLFNLPLTIGLLVFTAIPVISSLYYSFFEYDGLLTMDFIGFDNYVKIFTNDDEIFQVVINTIIYTVLSIPITLITSYLLAVLVNQEVKGVKAFRVIYYLPCMIPAVVSGLLWKDLFDPTFGIFNRILGAFGIPHSEFLNNEKSAMASIFLMNLWSVGGGMILWLAAFKNIPKDLYEASSIEGANGFDNLIKITIPLSTPMIFFNVITSVIGTLQYNGTLTFASRDGRGPENSVYMYAVKIYMEAFRREGIGYGSALAWLLLIVIGIITAILFTTSKWVFYGEDA